MMYGIVVGRRKTKSEATTRGAPGKPGLAGLSSGNLFDFKRLQWLAWIENRRKMHMYPKALCS